MTFLICAGCLFGMGILVALVPEPVRTVAVDPDLQAFRDAQKDYFSDSFSWR